VWRDETVTRDYRIICLTVKHSYSSCSCSQPPRTAAATAEPCNVACWDEFASSASARTDDVWSNTRHLSPENARIHTHTPSAALTHGPILFTAICGTNCPPTSPPRRHSRSSDSVTQDLLSPAIPGPTRPTVYWRGLRNNAYYLGYAKIFHIDDNIPGGPKKAGPLYIFPNI